MNDQKIYALMAKTPDIRAVQIADALDADLADVSAALRPLVEVGDVVQRKGFSPNGHPAQVYNLSDEFKKSREYKALAQTSAPFPAPVTPQAPAPAETDPPAAIEPSGSKVDRAIACITRLGAATDDQLRDAMGLPAKTYVGAYLTSAVKAGKVVRDGDRWKLGTGKTEAAPKVLDSVEQVGNIVVETKGASPIPQAVVDAIGAGPAPVAAPGATPAVPNLRCALWSDGTLELQRNGEEVARLTETEFAFIRDYMTQRVAA